MSVSKKALAAADSGFDFDQIKLACASRDGANGKNAKSVLAVLIIPDKQITIPKPTGL
ncbi:hypothetical protein ACWOA4_09980 [Pediococcus pentosaceus]|uniref:Uncharacterized protein n=1 Tax=Pediococcus pentosaceus (strain ATCC 25745 / CCUG 21536 / LMG 10740 / 183-1w) TaxID=278197 RepID=Q03GS9_PEDPA|nr:hypothetical protein [Pediococcus pentosaceus]ABJ67593.1 hypothetical protein PEPE_0500 [Pediococcus pentosaceus ATCC 25745]MBF7108903.1 hypothetical protein [Pediococcus pentosaceus]MDY8107498.1 hypothetical protein [Pediococcus pentosaceus]